MRFAFVTFFIALSLGVGGCGQKGPLTLPSAPSSATGTASASPSTPASAVRR